MLYTTRAPALALISLLALPGALATWGECSDGSTTASEISTICPGSFVPGICLIPPPTDKCADLCASIVAGCGGQKLERQIASANGGETRLGFQPINGASWESGACPASQTDCEDTCNKIGSPIKYPAGSCGYQAHACYNDGADIAGTFIFQGLCQLAP